LETHTVPYVLPVTLSGCITHADITDNRMRITVTVYAYRQTQITLLTSSPRRLQ